MGIEVKNITKTFGDTVALANINLNFNEPKIYGLLGNNGAGKSTLLNIITNRIYPTEGELLIDGESCRDNDRALCKLYMLSEKTLYPEEMKVKKAFESGEILYDDFDKDKAYAMAAKFSLPTNKRISKLSTGFTSIFKLIMAFSVNTPYLLLDEPVLGLDAQNRDLFYRLLMEEYAENPRTIIISTHLIAEVANMIEHTIIIKDGRILRDMPNETLQSAGYTISGPSSLVDSYIAGKEVLSVSSLGGLKTVCCAGKADAASLPEGLEMGRLNLQDYFIQLMNKEDNTNE